MVSDQAPETVEREVLDCASDVWMLGVTLWGELD